jgi:hypothetical protein
VSFNTWSRFVNCEFRDSRLSHIQTSDNNTITNLQRLSPYFDDHLLIHLTSVQILARKNDEKKLVNALNCKIPLSWLNESYEKYKIFIIHHMN